MYHCLTFPVGKLNTFSRSPYGNPRRSPRPPLPSKRLSHSYRLRYPLPVSSVGLYYRVTDDERLRMFPLDPMPTNARIITSTRRVNFRNDVKQRDGGQCLLTVLLKFIVMLPTFLTTPKVTWYESPHDCPSKSHWRQYIEALTRDLCRDL
jgi:hypothetical protein